MLREEIEKSGRSQTEWARRLRIGKGHLSMLLSGTKRPSLDLALRIAAMTDGAVPVESWARETASAPDAEEDAA